MNRLSKSSEAVTHFGNTKTLCKHFMLLKWYAEHNMHSSSIFEILSTPKLL